MDKIFDLEDRLVRYAGECVLFCETISKSYAGTYYANQLIRSSGSAALNFGEAKGT